MLFVRSPTTEAKTRIVSKVNRSELAGEWSFSASLRVIRLTWQCFEPFGTGDWSAYPRQWSGPPPRCAAKLDDRPKHMRDGAGDGAPHQDHREIAACIMSAIGQLHFLDLHYPVAAASHGRRVTRVTAT